MSTRFSEGLQLLEMQVSLDITFLTELCLIKAIVYKFVVTNFFGLCEIFFRTTDTVFSGLVFKQTCR